MPITIGFKPNLTTGTDPTELVAQFNQGFNAPADIKVALDSLGVSFKEDVNQQNYTIDLTNNAFQLGPAGATLDLVLPVGDYSATELVYMLGNIANQSGTSNILSLGMDYVTTMVNSNQMKLEAHKYNPTEISEDDIHEVEGIVQIANGFVEFTGTGPDVALAIGPDVPRVHSRITGELVLPALPPAGTNSHTIHILTDDGNGNGFGFGIDDADNYYYSIDGTENTIVGITPTTDDTFRLEHYGNTVSLTIKDSAGVTKTNQTFNIGLSMLSGQSGLSYYFMADNDAIAVIQNLEATQINVNSTSVNVIFNLGTQTLTNYLGLESPTNSNRGDPAVFQGQAMKGNLQQAGIKIVVDGLGSFGNYAYNGSGVMQRDNIVRIFHSLETFNTFTDYVETSPRSRWVNVNNATPLQISSIRIRFLSNIGDRPLRLEGNSSASILIYLPNE